MALFAVPLALKLKDKLTPSQKSNSSSNKNAPITIGSHTVTEPRKPAHAYDIFGWIKYIIAYFGYSVESTFYKAEDAFIRVLDIFEGASWLLLGALFYAVFTDNPIRQLAISGGQAAISAAPLLLL